MKVSELIKLLEKCDQDCEVFFEETTTKEEDGIEIGSITTVNSVQEVGVREDESQPWKVERVVLSNEL